MKQNITKTAGRKGPNFQRYFLLLICYKAIFYLCITGKVDFYQSAHKKIQTNKFQPNLKYLYTTPSLVGALNRISQRIRGGMEHWASPQSLTITFSFSLA